MEGQVFIIIVMVVAGLVSMVKKAIAEEKKKQEALIRAAQAKHKKKAPGPAPIQAATRIDRLTAEKMQQEELPVTLAVAEQKPALRAGAAVFTPTEVLSTAVFPDIREQLQGPEQLRELFVLKEVLDKPLALRHR